MYDILHFDLSINMRYLDDVSLVLYVYYYYFCMIRGIFKYLFI